MVCVFARKTSEPLASLVKQIDQKIGENGQLKSFANGIELSHLLADAKETHACYVQNMMTYLNGRALETDEQTMVDYYARLSRAGMLSLHDLELAIVTSDAFLNRLP